VFMLRCHPQSCVTSRPLLRCLTAAAAVLLCWAPAVPAQVSQSSMPLDSGFGPLDPTPPSVPVAQIVQEFTAKESLFKAALDDYTWTRTVKVQTFDDDGHQNGQYYQVVDIYYNPQGERMERVTDAPEGTLYDTTCYRDSATTSPGGTSTTSPGDTTATNSRGTANCNGEIMMTERDFSDIEERLPFVLTTEDAEQYDITYLGKQKVDEIETWVFAVKPKTIEKNKRYFEGRIWVDQKEHQIVVTDGKNVPDDLRPGHEDLTLPFITYRQMVDGKYWFPVYTVGQAVLHFNGGKGYLSDNANMREVLKYSNYHRFRTSIRVLYNGQDITNSAAPKGGSSSPAPNATPPSQQPTTVPAQQPQ